MGEHSLCHLLIIFVRMSYRRQKRWWNAYILFYERLDVMDTNRKMDVDRSKYSFNSLIFQNLKNLATASQSGCVNF